MTSTERALLRLYVPAKAAIVASAIAVDYGPRFSVNDGFNRCIKHGVHEIGVRSGPYGPTYDEALEAIVDLGKTDFSRSDVELGGKSRNSAQDPAGPTAPTP